MTSEAERTVGRDEFELILVNDGSPDNSLELAAEIVASDSRVRVINLSRNFGHHRAMIAGLADAKGDRIFLIDSDLEEDPSWLGEFWSELDTRQCDVVYGVQSKRKGGWFTNCVDSLPLMECR